MVHRSMSAVVLAAAMTMLVPGEDPAAGGVGFEDRLAEIQKKGIQKIAPTEMDLALSLVDQAHEGDERARGLAGLQLDLLEAIIEAHSMEAQASRLETDALEAEKDVLVEQAAYEFLVEQILSSGVASYWSGP